MAVSLMKKCRGQHSCNHIEQAIFRNIGEFCGSFYHVREYQKPMFITDKFDETKLECSVLCLQQDTCILGQLGIQNGKWINGPKYAFAVAELTANTVRYQKKYSNCYKVGRVTKHAEDFFCDDAETGELSKAIQECQTNGTLILYITIQPCHESKLCGETHTKSCSNKLVEVYNKKLKPRGIKFLLKVAFLHKAHWFTSDKSSCLAKEIENAKQGIRLMIQRGICVTAMKDWDWQRLMQIGGINPNEIHQYQKTKRAYMDTFIEKFLETLS